MSAEAEIRRKLATLYRPPQYRFVGHVGNATGFANKGWCDALAIQLWPSSRKSGDTQTEFEIKDSRADFRRQSADPSKGAKIRVYCSQSYLVVNDWSRILSSPGEVDDYPGTQGWGVIDVSLIDVRGKSPFVRGAAMRKAEPPDEDFWLAIERASGYAETEAYHDPYMRNVVKIVNGEGVLSTCEHRIAADLLRKAVKGARVQHAVHCYQCEAGGPAALEMVAEALRRGSKQDRVYWRSVLEASKEELDSVA